MSVPGAVSDSGGPSIPDLEVRTERDRFLIAASNDPGLLQECFDNGLDPAQVLAVLVDPDFVESGIDISPASLALVFAAGAELTPLQGDLLMKGLFDFYGCCVSVASLEEVRMLLGQGLDPNGVTVWDCSRVGKPVSHLLRVILSNGGRGSCWLPRDGDVSVLNECLRALLRSGADVNFQTEGGEKPLSAAARLGLPVVCLETLVSFGADIHHILPDGQSLLGVAGFCEYDTWDDSNPVAFFLERGVLPSSEEEFARVIERVGELTASVMATFCGIIRRKRFNIRRRDGREITFAMELERGGTYPALLEYFSHGGECSRGFRGEDNLGYFANDDQNLHRTLMTSQLRAHVREAESFLGPFLPRLPLGSLENFIEGLGEGDLASLRGDIANAAGRSLESIRLSILESARRFHGDLHSVEGALLSDGWSAVELVHARLTVACGGPKQAALCVCHGFLDAAHEYAWREASCHSGSISKMLGELQGRVTLGADLEKEGLPRDLDSYHKLLKKVQDKVDVEGLRAEAVARLIEKCERARLQEIHELMLDGANWDFVLNEFRGVFFSALAEEFGHVLAKFYIRAGDDGEIQMLDGMKETLWSLVHIAEIFVDCITSDPSHVPRVLEPLLQRDVSVVAVG